MARRAGEGHVYGTAQQKQGTATVARRAGEGRVYGTAQQKQVTATVARRAGEDLTFPPACCILNIERVLPDKR